jgi:hypothetical protein
VSQASRLAPGTNSPGGVSCAQSGESGSADSFALNMPKLLPRCRRAALGRCYTMLAINGRKARITGRRAMPVVVAWVLCPRPNAILRGAVHEQGLACPGLLCSALPWPALPRHGLLRICRRTVDYSRYLLYLRTLHTRSMIACTYVHTVR